MTKTRIKVIIACIIVIMLSLALLHLTNHYAYYSVNEIKQYNEVYLNTTLNENSDVLVNTSPNGSYDPRVATYAINGINKEVDSKIYNTFKISGLKPVTSYTANVRFTFDPVDAKGTNELNVGFISYEPESYVDPETNVSHSNITDIENNGDIATVTEDIESSVDITEVTTTVTETSDNNFTTLNVSDGTTVYNVQTTFETNEKGEIWLVIGMDSVKQQNIDYSLSNVIINYSEKK